MRLLTFAVLALAGASRLPARSGGVGPARIAGPAPGLVLVAPWHPGDAAAVRAAWRELPAAAQALPCLAYQVKQSEIDAVYAGTGIRHVAGFYRAPSSCFVNKQSSRAARDFAHEVGHLVWFQRLTAAQRATWAAWWGAHPGALPSDYARTNASEGWAESFAATYLRPGESHMRAAPAVAAMVRGLVGGS